MYRCNVTLHVSFLDKYDFNWSFILPSSFALPNSYHVHQMTGSLVSCVRNCG